MSTLALEKSQGYDINKENPLKKYMYRLIWECEIKNVYKVVESP